MKKILMILIIMISVISLSCCNNKNIKEEDDIMNKELILKINDNEVDVNWENNESINSLKNIINTELIINMNKYGGFEQVGSIGKSLPSKDIRITTEPGDIVLYSSNNIVIFYGSNTWEYTKLGHINLSKDELEKLLSKDNVLIKFELK